MPTPFQHHHLTDEQIAIQAEVREQAQLLYEKILTDVPVGRYKSLAFTALEEAILWSNKAVAFDSEGLCPSRPLVSEGKP
jgi:hypothetical protein